jgi:hypothetical protein
MANSARRATGGDGAPGTGGKEKSKNGKPYQLKQQ